MAIRVPSTSAGDHGTPRPEAPSVPVRLETCAIECWRGYRSSTFFAYLEDGTPLLESDSFRTRGAEPEAEGPALQAYNEVVAALEQLGWERHPDSFGAWYETRFVRWIEAPEEVPVAAAPPTEEEPIETWYEPVEVAPQRASVSPPAVAVPPPPVGAPPPPVSAPPPSAPAKPLLFAGPPPSVATRPSLFDAAPPQPVASRPPTQPAPADRRDRTPRGRRHLRGSTIAAVAGAVVALVVVALGMTGHGKQLPFLRTTVTHADRASVGAKTPASPKQAASTKHEAPKHAAAAVASTIRLSIRATGSDSWLEVRSRSMSGPVVYSGVLRAGRVLNFNGTAFWARFGAAGNLTIAVNGNRVPLKGTLEHMFAAPQR